MRNSPSLRAILLLSLLANGLSGGWAAAAPARFWISTDGEDPGTPGVARAVAASGVARRLYIWAQPRTTAAGEWNASTNPFLELQNVSLNVLSPQTTFSIDSTNIEVHNPTLTSGNPRFADVNDSSTGLSEAPGTSPGLYDYPPAPFLQGLLGLQGYSVPATDGDGFGGTCDSLDTYCGTTTDGSPAWLFASFSLTPTASSGTIEFSLQVGVNGMSHVGESSSAMQVEFGVDTLGLAPAAYDPSIDREVTFVEDDRDAVLSLAGPGDYNADGTVDELDFAVWKVQFGSKTYDADGNGDGDVDIADYTVWRNHLATAPAAISHSQAVPEPRTAAWLLLTITSLVRLSGATPSSSDG
ncbi:hypothetical protein NG895_04820 [Aeoliella sp. ICT_H6.2]|uniref:Dockerin domain-containing protein n=1 Tax=Aeoliella straminimaris TaxID=2954799 RepID=A0A9X2F6L1_9BACT|nr:hypothetical protein [Aeoliella straminimaris]MCO6043220.1 hypothetical protein [Aeoliella straminimaris]